MLLFAINHRNGGRYLGIGVTKVMVDGWLSGRTGLAHVLVVKADTLKPLLDGGELNRIGLVYAESDEALLAMCKTNFGESTLTIIDV